MSRVLLTKLHLIVAALMFPAMLMFLVTGALYTWGSKGDWEEEIVQVDLKSPLKEDQMALKQIALPELAKRDIPMPSGAASVSGEGTSLSLQWTGARSEVSVNATQDPLVAEVSLKQATFHRWLVQLHKAKGSTAFKIYATILAAALFLLVASGVVMGLLAKPLRRMTIASSLIGTGLFLGAVLLG